MRSLLITLLLCGAVAAAPVPPPRPRQVLPGSHTLVFGGASYRMVLGPLGHYEASSGACTWRGSWGWDAATRVLVIHESSDGLAWATYAVRMGEGLSGTLASGVAVEVKPGR